MNAVTPLMLSALLSQGMGGYVVPGVETGEVQMNVHVWGEVLDPGTYLLPFDADLVEAVSAAGGPTAKADLDAVRIVTSLGEVEYDLAGFLRG
ncbi:MAG TPA: SLBB domain-containing protein, partial [Candidatus Fermentibacter sp.]|nr:SLBB domain-containing protein [Candidatus Fermentibacter sp.]